MDVCTCNFPNLRPGPGGVRICLNCLKWHLIEDGSKTPAQGRRDHAAARAQFNASIQPNAACPCGSGKKFKKCCRIK